MAIDLDTFLVALYTIVDDLYQQHAAPAKPRRPGPPPVMSDSEVLTLALCRQWGGPLGARLSALRASALAGVFPAGAQSECL